MKIDKGLYTYTRNEKNLIAKTIIKKIKNSEQVKCRVYVLVNFNLMKTVICYADLKDKYIGKGYQIYTYVERDTADDLYIKDIIKEL